MLTLPETIETERLILRRLRYEDAEEIFYVYASKEVATRYVSWPTHRTIDDSRDFLQNAVSGWDNGTDYTFSIRLKKNGRFVGTIGLIDNDGKVQFGYALGPVHWGNGFATEACLAVIPRLSAISGITRIWTFVDAENAASVRVLTKIGLVEERRIAAWFHFVNQDNRAKDCIFFSVPPPKFPRTEFADS